MLLAEARETPSERVPLELFLAHRAGLEAHRTLYEPLLRGEPVDVPAAYREAALARRPEAVGDAPPDGFPPLYSDLGYILAGAALARHAGTRDAGEAIARRVLEPLSLSGRVGTVRDLDAAGIRGPFAPTEDVPWRGGPLVGAVHDENAWALTGKGGSGHAGLFGTAQGVLAFGCALIDALDPNALKVSEYQGHEPRDAPAQEKPWRNVDLRWLVRPRLGGSLRAGFDGKSEEGSSSGTKMGAHAFGHLGFVGTSLWIDPEAKVVVTLLTNRVCPSRDHLAIRAARPRAHDALWTRARELSESRP
jgi:CubicO group peptidase (beta-lactamase class C family)